MEEYHDTEWGVPVHDDSKLFEALSLGGAQAGLSWRTILLRREGYRRVFHNFDPERVARMSEGEVEQALLDPGIIRNRAKVRSVVHNARRVLEVQQEFGSLDAYLWGFVEDCPVVKGWTQPRDVPATTPLSDLVSSDFKKRGFSFVGSTIVYAVLQAVGIVNDHLVGCHRFAPLAELAPRHRSNL